MNNKSPNCANCSNPVNGNFCSHCGQSVRSRRGPIWRVLSELIEDFFSFDSSFYSSIYALFLKPGHLSREFVEGRRASILPPVRMYLVASLVFFLIFQIDPPDVTERNVYVGNVLVGQAEPNPEFGNLTIGAQNVFPWLDNFLEQSREALEQGNKQIVVNQLINSLDKALPNALIVFLPLLALLLKTLYFTKGVLYFDHLIFALHFQIWLMCWVMVIYGLSLINPVWSSLSAFVLVYLAMAQKRLYKQSYWSIIPKTFVIVIVYFLVIAILGVSSLLVSIVAL